MESIEELCIFIIFGFILDESNNSRYGFRSTAPLYIKIDSSKQAIISAISSGYGREEDVFGSKCKDGNLKSCMKSDQWLLLTVKQIQARRQQFQMPLLSDQKVKSL